MLQPEWNTDYGDTKYHTEYQMGEADPNAANQNPNDIHQHTEATAIIRATAHLASERAECQYGQFQSLKTKRNANDSNHHQQTGYDVFNTNHQPTQNNPQKVH